MAWQKGERGPGKGGMSKLGTSTSVYEALKRVRVEPVNRLIKIAETSQKEETKIAIWKYLIEMREGSIAKLGEAGALPSNEGRKEKDLLAELEGQKTPKPGDPPANVAHPAT